MEALMNKLSSTSRRTSRPNLIRSCLMTAGLSLGASQCFAVERSWGNASGGAFGTAANWQGGVVPGVSDNANFGLSTSFPNPIAIYTVNFTTNHSNQLFFVQDDVVTFD